MSAKLVSFFLKKLELPQLLQLRNETEAVCFISDARLGLSFTSCEEKTLN